MIDRRSVPPAGRAGEWQRDGVDAPSGVGSLPSPPHPIRASRATAAHRLSRRALVLIVLLFVLLVAARPAAAHPLDLGYLRLTGDGAELTAALDLHPSAAAHLAGVAPTGLTPAALHEHAAQLADATLRGAPITTPDGACRWTTVATALVDRTATITARAVCPAAPRSLAWSFPVVAAQRVSPTFQLLVKARLGGRDHVAIVDRARPSLALALAAPALGVAHFAWTGVEHIGAAPAEWRDAEGWKLPDGIDHILFVCALVLAGGTLLELITVVSGFTLGHSITLALSALDVVRPPSRWIEPLIALTIAIVAAQVARGRAAPHRWWIATGFGLVHGFGFASALNELDLATGDLVRALLGYNVGVELGQLAIVLAIAPPLLWLHRRPRYRGVTRALAAGIGVAGAYWFVQRLVAG